MGKLKKRDALVKQIKALDRDAKMTLTVCDRYHLWVSDDDLMHFNKKSDFFLEFSRPRFLDGSVCALGLSCVLVL